MQSKIQLLEEANEKFKNFYFERKFLNPEYFLKPGQSLPRVSALFLPSVRYENEDTDCAISKIEGSLVLKTKKGRTFPLKFFCFSDEDDASCFLCERLSRNIGHFAKTFVEFFLFEFLSQKQINLDEWDGWDLVKREIEE